MWNTIQRLAVLALAATAFHSPAHAQQDAEGTSSPFSLTANAGLVSSYRFRGLDQTFGKPAVQGGFDYTHASGLYAGNWNSNVSSGAGYPEGSLEMDFYAGYKTLVGDVGLDMGALYYYYPGTRLENAFAGVNRRHSGQTAGGGVNNGELYLAGTWRFLTLKYSHAVTDYFSMPGTRGSGYVDLSAAHDLGNGYVLGAHVGHLLLRDFSYRNADGSTYDGRYSDWRVGVTKDISGWMVGASYVGSDAQGRCANGEFYCFSSSLRSDGSGSGSRSRDAGRAVIVLSISRSF